MGSLPPLADLRSAARGPRRANLRHCELDFIPRARASRRCWRRREPAGGVRRADVAASLFSEFRIGRTDADAGAVGGARSSAAELWGHCHAVWPTLAVSAARRPTRRAPGLTFVATHTRARGVAALLAARDRRRCSTADVAASLFSEFRIGRLMLMLVRSAAPVERGELWGHCHRWPTCAAPRGDLRRALAPTFRAGLYPLARAAPCAAPTTTARPAGAGPAGCATWASRLYGALWGAADVDGVGGEWTIWRRRATGSCHAVRCGRRRRSSRRGWPTCAAPRGAPG